MKKLYGVLIALGLVTYISAQSCLPGGITLTRQSQVDSFAIIYPNFTEIELLEPCSTVFIGVMTCCPI